MTQPAVCADRVCFSRSRYTGKERDTESGNDYFEARYYSSAMGRFMSPDWSDESDPVPFAEFENPQSLNLYTYVNNNPLRSTDPDGHMHEECHHSQTSTQDAEGTIHVTESEHCEVVRDASDNLAQRSIIPLMNFAHNHPLIGAMLAPSCPDPKNCIQVGVLPWGMTGDFLSNSNQWPKGQNCRKSSTNFTNPLIQSWAAQLAQSARN